MTNILDPDYESDLTNEEHEKLMLMSEHAVAPPLSSAVKAIDDAFWYTINNKWNIYDRRRAQLAAAFRAAALYCKRDRIQLLAIADELESL